MMVDVFCWEAFSAVQANLVVGQLYLCTANNEEGNPSVHPMIWAGDIGGWTTTTYVNHSDAGITVTHVAELPAPRKCEAGSDEIAVLIYSSKEDNSYKAVRVGCALPELQVFADSRGEALYELLSAHATEVEEAFLMGEGVDDLAGEG